MLLSGVFLPVITPFKDGEIDFESYRRLLEHYIPSGIAGIIPNGTTGECPAISEKEFELLLDETVKIVQGRLPVYFGVGGNYTKKVIEQLTIVNKYEIEGILSVTPYYNRPDQRGIYEHFKALSGATDKKIILYNIPYRTGRNMENDTIRKLSQIENIIGIKDACGDIKQSMDLLLNRPDNFSILTGEDILYHCTMSLGGDGGILASAHIATEKFVEIYRFFRQNDYQSALRVWSEVSSFIPDLFAEPNPAPLKYLLAMQKMIDSDEVRLPLMGISDGLKEKLNRIR